MQPEGLSNRVFDNTAGRLYFRRWAEQSLDALRESVAGRERAGAAVTPR
jgi:hypothetical protein